MEGREVYRHAIARMVEATGEAIERAGLTIDDVDLFVAHQANVRILTAAANELGLPPEKVMVNIDRVANTSSASIPLALAEAERDGPAEARRDRRAVGVRRRLRLGLGHRELEGARACLRLTAAARS